MAEAVKEETGPADGGTVRAAGRVGGRSRRRRR